MGCYDTIITTVTCPCCKQTHLHEGVQTKDFECSLSEIFQDDDTRNLPKIYGERENAFSNIENAKIKSVSTCVSCGSFMDIVCEIRNYIMIGATAQRVSNGSVMDVEKLTGKFAAENQLLLK